MALSVPLFCKGRAKIAKSLIRGVAAGPDGKWLQESGKKSPGPSETGGPLPFLE